MLLSQEIQREWVVWEIESSSCFGFYSFLARGHPEGRKLFFTVAQKHCYGLVAPEITVSRKLPARSPLTHAVYPQWGLYWYSWFFYLSLIDSLLRHHITNLSFLSPAVVHFDSYFLSMYASQDCVLEMPLLSLQSSLFTSSMAQASPITLRPNCSQPSESPRELVKGRAWVLFPASLVQ